MVLCARLCTYPGKGGVATGTPRRNGSDDAEVILRTQLGFTQAMVDNFAKSTEAYQLMWRPFGGPAVGTMRTALEAQLLYLKELRNTVY